MFRSAGVLARARGRVVVLVAVLALVASGCNWTATFGAGLQAQTQFDPYPTPGCQAYDTFDDQTLRQVVHISLGGTSVRVRLSNRADDPVAIGAATLAIAADASGGSSAVQSPPTALTFAGSATVTIPPLTEIVSDPLSLTVPADHDVAVSLHFPDVTTPAWGATRHYWSAETSHVGPGNLVASEGPGFTSCTTVGYFVAGLDVSSAVATGTVVVLGDSKSDGILFIVRDSEQRWSEQLYDRLAANPSNNIAVANVAIAGETVLGGASRLERDVLQAAGVKTVVVALGTNDLFQGRTSAQIQADLEQLTAAAHAAGVRVVAATIPPIFNPGTDPDPEKPWEQTREDHRQAVNSWIRTGPHPFDAIADFDAVLRDPTHPVSIDPDYAGAGVSEHPGPAGHEVMANAIDLASLVV